MRTPLAAAVLFALMQLQARPPEIAFRTQMIDGGASETAAIADINKDGRLDVIAEGWAAACRSPSRISTPTATSTS